MTKTYKLADNNTAKNINNELKNIATHLNIANRIEPMAQTPAFISLNYLHPLTNASTNSHVTNKHLTL